MQKLTTVQFKLKAREKHGNRYDYSQTQYDGANRKVVIICKHHGPFLQRAADHLLGKGCPRCVGRGTQRQQDWIEDCIMDLCEFLTAVT